MEFILVVEDNAGIRQAMCEVLEDEGYAVEHASNGQQALDVMASGRLPWLILLDLNMPVMDGWTFRGIQLRDARLREIPVCVMSAASQYVGAPPSLRFLSKPISIDELLDAVGRLALRHPSRAVGQESARNASPSR
jgi:CheY-like chemotaxis protein